MLFSKRVRTVAKRVVPKPILFTAWNAYCRLKARQARAIFEQAGATPAWESLETLAELQTAYPLEALDYRYDPETLARRGEERALAMLFLVREKAESLRYFLDLGAWDGMTCAALQQMGKQTVGIDIRPEGFTDAARASGVTFLQMDAAAVGLADNSFDFAFSYNSFEHFPDPEQVLCEAMRVVRPGGYIYLNFGPLYYSPKGAHQFKTISVPYCQVLFTKEQLTEFAAAQGIELMGFFWMNEWSLRQYRALWSKYAQRLRKAIYYETYTADHVDLIARYPTCFKSEGVDFEDFIVGYIEVLFQVRP